MGFRIAQMMNWVKKFRPPVVILENVCSAPWEGVADRFRDIGYNAQFTRLDTKFYYIPHTRTVRPPPPPTLPSDRAPRTETLRPFGGMSVTGAGDGLARRIARASDAGKIDRAHSSRPGGCSTSSWPWVCVVPE